jgi:WD40 repeat protein
MMIADQMQPTLILRAPGSVKSVVFSPDGQYLAYASAEHVIVLAREDNEQMAVLTHESTITCLAWSPVRPQIAAAGARGKIEVWGASSCRRLAVFHGPDHPANNIAWSPDGRYLASGGRTWQVWDADSGELRLHRDRTGYVASLAWSPSGDLLATCEGSHLVVWDLEGEHAVMRERGTYIAHLTGVAWSPDGALLATSGWDRFARVWEARTGKQLLTYQGHHSPLQALAWSPDGNRVATSSGDGFWPRPADTSIQVWDASTGQALSVSSEIRETVQALAWSPDGMKLAAGSKDGSLHLWSPQAGI